MGTGLTGTRDGSNANVTPRVEHMSRRSGSGSRSGVSAPRHSRRADRGMVRTITPTTKTGESSEAYSRRMNRRGFSQEVQHKSRLKRWGFILVALLLIVGIGGAAAYFAFNASVDSKIASSDEKLSKALVAAEANTPYYVLLCADLDDYDGLRGVNTMMLVRVDESAKQATMVVLPGNLRVSSDGDATSLSRVMDAEGEGRVVSLVSSALGVSISHFLYVDRTAFTSLVDSLGGIDVTIEEAVDDPRAGSDYITAGDQTLNGTQAATFLRAYNYKQGVDTMFSYQRRFAVSFAAKFFSTENGLKMGSLLDELSAHITTDWTVRQLEALAETLKGMSADTIYTAQVDGYETTLSQSNVTVFIPTTSDVTSLMEAVDAGKDPSYREQKQTVDVDKDSFEITVKNGSGMTGGASMIASILENAGFHVAETGNAESYVYTETLVIYLDPAYEKACEAVVQALGTGRVVNGINGYTFDTEVMVVLGSDWKPLN